MPLFFFFVFLFLRATGKSDISERSDLSAELKTGKQKMMELKPQPNSKSMWPSRERTINSSRIENLFEIFHALQLFVCP
jgi:hypothetical protein